MILMAVVVASVISGLAFIVGPKNPNPSKEPSNGSREEPENTRPLLPRRPLAQPGSVPVPRGLDCHQSGQPGAQELHLAGPLRAGVLRHRDDGHQRLALRPGALWLGGLP